jgi:hypothetical protein
LRENFSLKNKDQYVLQHMVSYTFPHNLDRMQSLLRQLRIQFETLTATEAAKDTPPLPDGSDIPGEKETTDEERDDGDGRHSDGQEAETDQG